MPPFPSWVFVSHAAVELVKILTAPDGIRVGTQSAVLEGSATCSFGLEVGTWYRLFLWINGFEAGSQTDLLLGVDIGDGVFTFPAGGFWMDVDYPGWARVGPYEFQANGEVGRIRLSGNHTGLPLLLPKFWYVDEVVLESFTQFAGDPGGAGAWTED